jgi:hypothetical protein
VSEELSMSCAPSVTVTCPALPPAGLRIDPCIEEVIRVALRAVCLRFHLCTANASGITASDIHLMRHSFEVVWSYAVMHSTKVVKFTTIWNRAKSEGMSADCAVAFVERPVTALVMSASPEPACLSLDDMLPKAIFWGNARRAASRILVGHRVTSGVLGRAFTALRPFNFTTLGVY